MEKLGFFGGDKTISVPLPHWEWNWCPATDDEIKTVVDYMQYGKLNKNGYPDIVSTFEKKFSDYHGVDFSLMMNSGTSSIHTAFFALGIGPGDEVLAPTLTFPATATPILHVNAVPVLCDCLPDTATIDPAEIERKISKKTKAVIITHLWGHPCEMSEILDIVSENNLSLIEDCSHAHGAKYKGKLVGTFGDIGCFSLDSQKMMASGEAGVMITNDRRLFERALLFSDFGPRIKSELTIPEYKRFNMTGYGLKYRVHPLAAAIANEKLKKLDWLNSNRNCLLNSLSEKIANLPGIKPPVTRDYVYRGAFFGYKPFYKSEEFNNLPLDAFINIMEAEGMDIRPTGTPPLHLLELFKSPEDGMYHNHCPRKCALVKQTYNYNQGDLPKSEQIIKGTFSLPTFSFKHQKELIDLYALAFMKVTEYLSEASPMQIKKIMKEMNRGVQTRSN